MAKPLSGVQAIVQGTLVVGVLDATDAVIYWWIARGSSPVRVFQGIATGFFGRASFDGGLVTAAIGLLVHFFIAFWVVTTYFVASRRIEILRRQPLICGPIYGLLVYFFMNKVVIPLSAIGATPHPAWPLFLNGILIHMIGVGLPSALFAAHTVHIVRPDPLTANAGSPRTPA